MTEKEQERNTNVHLEAVGPGRPAGGAVHLGAQEQVQLDKVQVQAQEQVQVQEQAQEKVPFFSQDLILKFAVKFVCKELKVVLKVGCEVGIRNFWTGC